MIFSLPKKGSQTLLSLLPHPSSSIFLSTVSTKPRRSRGGRGSRQEEAMRLRSEEKMKFWFLACLLYQATMTTNKAAAAAAAAAADESPKWLTQSGDAPLVIARGGFSGIFPESSHYAYQLAVSTSLSDVVLFCDLQLAKDGTGICHSGIRLDNSTTISSIYPKAEKSYTVNGESVRGWFSVDYPMNKLFNKVSLIQSIFSRPSAFDGVMPISLVEDVTGLRPPKFWMNVEYYSFLKQHKQDAADFVMKAVKVVRIDYISSPEVGFLKSIKGKVRKAKTVFRFLAKDAVEPSTNETYASLLKDLSNIKKFASGILVPKTYIWPVGSDQYLQPHTTLVDDAHKAGLEVYASGFANDYLGSYNYSYDPTAEYLQFFDNSKFAVDGVLTDFPSTASESIACFAHKKNTSAPSKGKPLVITHNGASGVFAASTDLAYQKAVEDGADIIDCSVQLSKDGAAFCLNTADLSDGTNAMTTFMARSTMIPDIQKNSGIFSFELTWEEIQTLKPVLSSPYSQTGLLRNPAMKNEGKLMQLSEFLDFAKEKKAHGILLDIKNAAYLASKKGLGIVDIVTSALKNASYDKQSTQQVLIQSDDSSVLSKFPNYRRVLEIDDVIGDAPKLVAEEIKNFADAVNVPKSSIIANNDGFLTSFTDVMDNMHATNISVYVSVFSNEFTTIAFDFFSDPMVEIATYVSAGIDGIVTDYPATSIAYIRSPCFNPDANLSYTILPAEPGSLLQVAPPEALPPAAPPAPALQASDVVDPPLPPVTKEADAEEPTASPASDHHSSGQLRTSINVVLCLSMVAILCLASLSKSPMI